MEYELKINGCLHRISAETDRNDLFTLTDSQGTVRAELKKIGPQEVSLLIENESYRAVIAENGGKKHVFVRGFHFEIIDASREEENFAGAQDSSEDKMKIKSPMPGRVIKINTRKGQKVRKNQTLAVVEAMKMENEIKCGIDGIVKKIYAAPGDLIDSAKILIELENGDYE